MEENQFQVIDLEKDQTGPRHRRVRKIISGLTMAAASFIILGLGWFFWGRSSSFSEKNIELTIESPREISSGEQVAYWVKLTNRNSQALREAKLFFSYPDGSALIKDGQLVQLSAEEINLGEIMAGEEKQWEFPAWVVGNLGETKRATTKLIFTPEQVRSSFEKEAEAITNIKSLDVSLTLVAPPNSVSGQTVTYILDYRNTSPRDLADLKVKFIFPDGFTPTRFNPAPSLGNDTWGIKMVKIGEGNRITVEGILRGAERESKSIAVVLQRMAEGVAVDYEKSFSVTVISTPLLAVEAAINGQSGNYTAQLGETLDYRIKFANNSEIELTGLTISAKLEGSMIDFFSLQSNGFFDAASKTITWNASSSPLLNRLAAGQYGSLDFKVNLKSGFPPFGLGAKDFIVKANIKAETLSVPPDFFSDTLTAQTESTVKIKSLPSFEQAVGYSGGEFTGGGPIPPQAGKKTVFTIVWRISNLAGEVTKVKMRGALSEGISWENQTKVSGQQSLPIFKTSTQEVVWEVGVVPAGTGSTAPKYEAWFQISATPSVSQSGTALDLIKNLILEGEDGLTKQAFLLRGKDLNTNDLMDYPNQGTVVE